MTRIPRTLHYTFGFAADFGGKPWSLIHHVCVMSAIKHLRPNEVLFYYEYEPSGPWWELTKVHVSLVKITAPTEIYGRTLHHVAHKADVVRLRQLLLTGGIYLDADVMVHRDFDELLEESVVLGREGEDSGMANAVIVAEPEAPFLRRWLAEYKSFRSKGHDVYWGEHSVHLPSKLAKQFPDEVTVLTPRAFYWPLWSKAGIQKIFVSKESLSIDGVYANHLWESAAWNYLEGLTPRQVFSRDTNFHRWARPYLKDLPLDYGRLTLKQRCDIIARRGRIWSGRAYAAAQRRIDMVLAPERVERPPEG